MEEKTKYANDYQAKNKQINLHELEEYLHEKIQSYLDLKSEKQHEFLVTKKLNFNIETEKIKEDISFINDVLVDLDFILKTVKVLNK